MVTGLEGDTPKCHPRGSNVTLGLQPRVTFQMMAQIGQIYPSVGGGGDPKVWRTSFSTMPRPEDFKPMLHFMYATCTDKHIWPEGCDFAF